MIINVKLRQREANKRQNGQNKQSHKEHNELIQCSFGHSQCRFLKRDIQSGHQSKQYHQEEKEKKGAVDGINEFDHWIGTMEQMEYIDGCLGTQERQSKYEREAKQRYELTISCGFRST